MILTQFKLWSKIDINWDDMSVFLIKRRKPKSKTELQLLFKEDSLRSKDFSC